MSRRKGNGLSCKRRRVVREYVAKRDGWQCFYCRTPFAELDGVTLDHYVPFCLWPMSKRRNLVLACEPCNQAKADALPLTLAWLLLRHAEQIQSTYAPAA